MITNSSVKEDTGKTLPKTKPYQINVDIGTTAHNEVSYLLQEIPAEMLKRDNYRYSDGYVDGPGVTATAYIDGKEYVWYIEGFALEYGSGKEKDTKDYIEEFLRKVWNASLYLQEH